MNKQNIKFSLLSITFFKVLSVQILWYSFDAECTSPTQNALLHSKVQHYICKQHKNLATNASACKNKPTTCTQIIEWKVIYPTPIPEKMNITKLKITQHDEEARIAWP
jgi:hypothetical protein